MTASTLATPVEPELLNPRHVDTCDACGPSASASFWAELEDGKELSYCGHHGTKYKKKIVTVARVVHDLTYIAMSR